MWTIAVKFTDNCGKIPSENWETWVTGISEPDCKIRSIHRNIITIGMLWLSLQYSQYHKSWSASHRYWSITSLQHCVHEQSWYAWNSKSGIICRPYQLFHGHFGCLPFTRKFLKFRKFRACSFFGWITMLLAYILPGLCTWRLLTLCTDEKKIKISQGQNKRARPPSPSSAFLGREVRWSSAAGTRIRWRTINKRLPGKDFGRLSLHSDVISFDL